ncbi:restriction endonuclease [Chloroflexi bacterium TSY]|nr:restriction endonuclease [Chloroflexi bacterium TSY]
MIDHYHYPADLFNLLVQAIPNLFRSKKDVLQFFRGAGVDFDTIQDLWIQVERDRQSISKYEITRIVLSRLNEQQNDKALRQRREIIKQITEFEDFSSAWEDRRMTAQGLVAAIRNVVNVKDSFTRMHSEREQERQQRIAEQERKATEIQTHKTSIEEIKRDLYPLFSETDKRKRGIALEKILNRLFDLFGISVRESFHLVKEEGQGIAEQIDGAIELDGNLYLVEMKWIQDPIDINHVSRHLVRVHHRGYSRGIFVSATEFTKPALETCRDALKMTVVFLCTLEEIVKLLESEGDLVSFLKEKEHAAIAETNPFKQL